MKTFSFQIYITDDQRFRSAYVFFDECTLRLEDGGPYPQTLIAEFARDGRLTTEFVPAVVLGVWKKDDRLFMARTRGPYERFDLRDMHTPGRFELSALEAMAAEHNGKDILIIAETPEVKTAAAQIAKKALLPVTLF